MMTLSAATPGLSLSVGGKSRIEAKELSSVRQCVGGAKVQAVQPCLEPIRSRTLRVRASDLAEQFKEMRAAEKRWEKQVYCLGWLL